MSAWIEIDRLGPDVRSTPGVWERIALETARTLPIWSRARSVPDDVDVGSQRNDLVAGAVEGFGWRHLLDVAHKGLDRWFIRPRAPAIVRNGTVLVVDERYPLENGDRIEVSSGTWLRFLDDSVPLALPRLREVGRAFLFAPTPADGAERWRAFVRGSDDLLVAAPARVPNGDESLLRAAFPDVVDVLHTPRGPYALVTRAAGVTLAALVELTGKQGAALDPLWSTSIARAVRAAQNRALARGWPDAADDAGQVVITWEGAVAWLGFLQKPAPSSFSGDVGEGALSTDEASALAGVVARLFPEERAAELALREEVALWTRDGLAALERATRGRPSP